MKKNSFDICLHYTHILLSIGNAAAYKLVSIDK